MLIQKTRWHFDADVIVIGFGAAGASAALAAHDSGSQALVIEKQDNRIPYSNSFMSGGAFIGGGDPAGLLKYASALTNLPGGASWTDPETMRAWVEQSIEARERLERMGASLELFSKGGAHQLPGTEAVDVYRFAGAGPGMMRFLSEQMERRTIPVVSGAKAEALLRDSHGRVTGVAAKRQSNGEPVNVRARRAVVLATGGFEFDEDLKLQFLKVHPCYFSSSPWNTGDGVRMAMGAGAQLWHMNCSIAGCVMKFPDVPLGMSPLFGGRHWMSPALSALPAFGGEGWRARHKQRTAPAAGYIIVDQHGRRYADENIKGHEFLYDMAVFDSRRLAYPRVPSYWVFDQKRMSSGPLRSPVRASRPRPSYLYEWSQDNSVELERGWITQGKTVKELAARLQIEPSALAKTVKAYNDCCEKGVDGEFGRVPGTLMPLADPPYYAVKLWPGGLNTLGGPRRDALARIVGADGLPVPGLYGAGELGSVHGMLYPGTGGNLAECLGLGHLAGANAAGCKPA
ncbi:MAG: FAD-binding protein [Chloroflexi bacterium]|nr:FAD-binding protein [Chloroflexota bacterium]